MKIGHLRLTRTLLFVMLLGFIVLAAILNSVQAQNWWTASREPVGLAPDPASTPEAIIQVYGARAYSWRGYLGIHTWIAVKPAQAKSYTIYEVIGWLQRRKMPVVVIHENLPDRRWYGNKPEILAEKRGDGVDALIEKLIKQRVVTPMRKITLYGRDPIPIHLPPGFRAQFRNLSWICRPRL